MQWEFIAHGAGVLAHATTSTHIELHALRSGLECFLSAIPETGTREAKRGISPAGALVKARRSS